MSTFVRLYLSSAGFGILMAAVYYVWSHREWAGSILLGMMALGLCFAAGYAILAERDADLSGDRKDNVNKSARSEDLGIYTVRSAYPVLLAFSILVLLIGAIWVPFLLYAGLFAILLILWRLGAESSRIG